LLKILQVFVLSTVADSLLEEGASFEVLFDDELLSLVFESPLPNAKNKKEATTNVAQIVLNRFFFILLIIMLFLII